MAPKPAPSGSDSEFVDRRSSRRSAHRAVYDARQKLTSISGTRLSYDYELMRGYAESRRSTWYAMPLMLAILALIASLWVPVAISAGWAVLVFVINTAVVLLCKWFLKKSETKRDPQKWIAVFVTSEILYGVVWSTLALFPLFTDSPNLNVVMFAMVLMGVAANAFAARSLPNASIASTLPMTVTVSAHLLSQGGILNYSLAAVTIGGAIFFLTLAKQLYQSELGSFKYRAEKDALIFELKEAQAMSEEARRHAEQANIAKSRFLATMSHELRTPLNAIIGFSEVLKSELLGGHQVPQYKEYAGDIHSSGLHLLNLINELLDLSRIEAGKYELNEEAINLVDIADDCRRMLEIKAKSKGVELEIKFPEELPKIWGDERAIRQVVLNLLSNAIKFTPQSGKISLTVGESDDGGQFIAVKDTGPGIPQDEIETVLSSFGQGSLAQKTAEQGAGLGLPIVQEIMNLHQGRFDLFSKLRFGTEVIATFPRARTMNALAAVHQERPQLKTYAKS